MTWFRNRRSTRSNDPSRIAVVFHIRLTLRPPALIFLGVALLLGRLVDLHPYEHLFEPDDETEICQLCAVGGSAGMANSAVAASVAHRPTESPGRGASGPPSTLRAWSRPPYRGPPHVV